MTDPLNDPRAHPTAHPASSSVTSSHISGFSTDDEDWKDTGEALSNKPGDRSAGVGAKDPRASQLPSVGKDDGDDGDDGDDVDDLGLDEEEVGDDDESFFGGPSLTPSNAEVGHNSQRPDPTNTLSSAAAAQVGAEQHGLGLEASHLMLQYAVKRKDDELKAVIKAEGAARAQQLALQAELVRIQNDVAYQQAQILSLKQENEKLKKLVKGAGQDTLFDIELDESDGTDELDPYFQLERKEDHIKRLANEVYGLMNKNAELRSRLRPSTGIAQSELWGDLVTEPGYNVAPPKLATPIHPSEIRAIATGLELGTMKASQACLKLRDVADRATVKGEDTNAVDDRDRLPPQFRLRLLEHVVDRILKQLESFENGKLATSKPLPSHLAEDGTDKDQDPRERLKNLEGVLDVAQWRADVIEYQLEGGDSRLATTFFERETMGVKEEGSDTETVGPETRV